MAYVPALIAAYGAIKQGHDASNASLVNAQIQRNESNVAVDNANQQENQVRRNSREALARQTAAFGASGTGYTGSNAVGMAVFAPGVVTTGQPGTMIQQNGAVVTTVTAVNSGAKTITLSLNASYTQLQANIQISGLVELDYMGGTPVTDPTWTPYIPDQYKLKDYGRAGIIRVYGLIQRIYDSSIRATYWAGYLINWANAGDNATHTLPADISGAVESMVMRRFKRRQSGDLNSISFGGSNNSWDKDIPLEVKDALNRYRRAPIYF